MSRYNRGAVAAARSVKPATGYLTTEPVASGTTHEGAPGFGRDAKSELFLLAVTNLFSDTFYEKQDARYTRYRDLIRQVAVSDPNWMGRFLPWLRKSAHMRTGPVVGALEAADAMVKAKIQGSRAIVNSVLVRADEPGEALSYWLSIHGRKLPKPIKRGIADAATRLYDEFNFLKWDSSRASVRFADVLELCHVAPDGISQASLFRHIINDRHGNASDDSLAELAPMIHQSRVLRVQARKNPDLLLSTDVLRAAGFTWEDALSLLGQIVSDGPELDRLKCAVWEAAVPIMGYMALLRNLRNLIKSGTSPEVTQRVLARLTDPDQVRRSQQLPLRFYSAFRATEQWTEWAHALETALNLSLENVPTLPGRTLVLVDVSGSMVNRLSAKSELTRVQAAGLFGAALTVRNFGNVDLVAFNEHTLPINVSRGQSLLKLVDRFQARGGTMTAAATRVSYAGHDRVIIITDEQSYDGDPSDHVPANVPLYIWDLGGYKYGHTPSTSNRYIFGGLTDQAFGIIPLLEAGASQNWPF